VTFQSQSVNTTSGGQFVVLSNTGTGPLTFNGFGHFDQRRFCAIQRLRISARARLRVVRSLLHSHLLLLVHGAGFVYFTNNAGTQTVTLSGTGATATPHGHGFAGEAWFFPVQLVHVKSAAQSVVLTNTGTAAIKVTSVAISGDFCQDRYLPGESRGREELHV